MPAMRPILYSFRRCPYAMRARLAIFDAGIEVELREVVLKNKPAEMLAASPKGTVPVLVLPDGQVIEESMEIMAWAMVQKDGQDQSKTRFTIPLDYDQIHQAGALIQANDLKFKTHLDRYKYPNRYSDELNGRTEESFLDHHRDQAMIYIQNIEDQLSDDGYLFGNRPSLGDFAILPFIRQFAHTDISFWDHAEIPKSRNWLNLFKNSDYFASVMKKYDAWVTDDDASYFGS